MKEHIARKERLIQIIKRRIKRCEKFINQYQEDNSKLTKHGYWSYGYYEGRLSALEDILCILENIGDM